MSEVEEFRATIELLERAAKLAAEETRAALAEVERVRALHADSSCEARVKAAEAKLAVALPFVSQHALAMAWGRELVEEHPSDHDEEPMTAKTLRAHRNFWREVAHRNAIAAENARAQARAGAEHVEKTRERLVEQMNTIEQLRSQVRAHETRGLLGDVATQATVDALDALRSAFDVFERVDPIVTIETEPNCVAWFVGKRSAPTAGGRRDGFEAALLDAAEAMRGAAERAPLLRVATPEELPAIRASFLPSNERALAKVIAQSESADAHLARAHEQASKVRREIRDAFQTKWGAFWKCSVAGCGKRLTVAPGSHRICSDHPEGPHFSTGYAPPPEGA